MSAHVGTSLYDFHLAPESKAALPNKVFVELSAALPDDDLALIVVLRFLRFLFPDSPEPIQVGYAS